MLIFKNYNVQDKSFVISGFHNFHNKGFAESLDVIGVVL